MVDQALLERTRQLDNEDKVELAYELLRMVQDSQPVSSETAALIDERVAHAEQNPDDGVLWGDLRPELRHKYA